MRPACVCIAFLVAACIGIATASTVAVSPVDWDTRATVRWLQTLGKEYGQVCWKSVALCTCQHN